MSSVCTGRAGAVEPSLESVGAGGVTAALSPAGTPAAPRWVPAGRAAAEASLIWSLPRWNTNIN